MKFKECLEWAKEIYHVYYVCHSGTCELPTFSFLQNHRAFSTKLDITHFKVKFIEMDTGVVFPRGNDN